MNILWKIYLLVIILITLCNYATGQIKNDDLNPMQRNGFQAAFCTSGSNNGFIHYSPQYTFEKNRLKYFIGPAFGPKIETELGINWRRKSKTIELKGFNFGVLYVISKPSKKTQWTVQYDLSLSDYRVNGMHFLIDTLLQIQQNDVFHFSNTIAPGIRFKCNNKVFLNIHIAGGIVYYNQLTEQVNRMKYQRTGISYELSFGISLEFKLSKSDNI